MSTLKDLRVLAKSLGIRGHTTAKKAELIEKIEAHQGAGSQKPQDTAAPPAHFEKVEAPKAEADSKEKSKETKEKKPHAWNTFVAEYRKEHGCSLKEAMTKKAEYAEYKAKLAAK